MTDFDRRVHRRTLHAYHVSLTGVVQTAAGRRLVATLHGDERGDWLTIRESGRRYRVTLDVAELYRRAMIADAMRMKKERAKARKERRTAASN